MKVKKLGSLWEPSLFFAPKISEKDGGTKDKKLGAWMVVPTALLPVDISASGYSTLFAPQTLAAQDETTIYAATLDQTAGLFKLTSTDGIVPAGQGVVIKATEGLLARAGRHFSFVLSS